MRVSVLVAHRVTEIYSSSFARALLRAIESRSLDGTCDARASQQRICALVCGSFERDAIKIKGTEESQVLSPIASGKKEFRVTFFEHFFFDLEFFFLSFLRALLARRVLSHYYYFTTTTATTTTTTRYCLCYIILSPLNRFRRS